ncbi:MAG TPA: hypothetical protein VNW95_01210 [Mucilaginibacter sp.]|jgi:hypothetical protein|nr:hypothetical protein [Mucilaginibacter sp.]
MKLILVLIFCTTNLIAQQKSYRQGCDFLKDLHYTNGVDTIVVLAYKDASVKPPPYDNILSKLNNERKLHSKDFKYTVTFKPLGCTEIYPVSIQCKDASHFAFNVNENTYHHPVKLRCIVFEGCFEFSRPYFVIDKIMPYDKE